MVKLLSLLSLFTAAAATIATTPAITIIIFSSLSYPIPSVRCYHIVVEHQQLRRGRRCHHHQQQQEASTSSTTSSSLLFAAARRTRSRRRTTTTRKTSSSKTICSSTSSSSTITRTSSSSSSTSALFMMTASSMMENKDEDDSTKDENNDNYNNQERNNNDGGGKHVIIAGGGMIGTATAYYLAKNHKDTVSKITMIDVTGTIAPAASGKAGGFLAYDWNDFDCTGQLTRRSFQLHQDIANEFGSESIQYRRLTCSSIMVDPYTTKNRKPMGKKLDGIEWASTTTTESGTVVTGGGEGSSSSAIVGVRNLGTEETIAQVHPKMLCERLWEETKKKLSSDQCNLIKGKVVRAVHDPKSGQFQGAMLENGDMILGDKILFACGPWTANIMFGIKYHSVLIPTDRVLSQCVFFSGCGDPEVYVRPDKTAYCTGYPEPAIPVTELPGQESIRPDKIESIVSSVRDASGSVAGRATTMKDGDSDSDATVLGVGALHRDPIKQQACYLPATSDSIPVMGELPNLPSCYIATGHTCWGILLGPASGESMASLIATGKGTNQVDLSPFTPKRFSNIQPVTL